MGEKAKGRLEGRDFLDIRLPDDALRRNLPFAVQQLRPCEKLTV